jgi:outer membrane protein OmpA-like peptidoglycan-associated protein
VVDQIAAVMIGNPNVIEWRIVLAARRRGTDEETRGVSQAQADEVRDYLIARGVKAKLEALGAVDDDPALYVVARDRKPDDAPNVCPAGSLVKPRPEPDR